MREATHATEPRKIALITGASRGIGRAIALQLAESGLRIALHYRSNHRAAEQTLRELAGDGHALFSADLAEPNAAAQLAADVLAHFAGRVDLLVHNAGLYLPTPMLETQNFAGWQAALREQMQLNFIAGAELARLLAPAMREAGWGRIIQIASRSGLRGEAGFAGYGASKAAQINFTKSLAAELAPDGIGCFAIAPGWVETEMSAAALAEKGERIRAEIPAGRVATPDDIAQLVAWLCTPAADYLTGNTIDVNGASYLR
ncbi:MAG: SDR family oxidoreductase [Verrucomicrobiota bacterium]|nr:SDR family oxidoreductase [Verrucomicrobiota bacterium]